MRAADDWGRGTAPGSDVIALRTEPTAGAAKVTVKGWAEEQRNGRTIATQQPVDYECDLMNFFRATHTVTRPAAYAVSADLPNVIENLRLHGITFTTLARSATADAETYTIDSAKAATRLFQGHAIITAEATPSRGSVELPAGTIIVPTDQPLGMLAAYMLEPECEDGLVAWNFLDDFLKPGATYPILRIMRPLP